jgi:hypothetical protein
MLIQGHHPSHAWETPTSFEAEKKYNDRDLVCGFNPSEKY